MKCVQLIKFAFLTVERELEYPISNTECRIIKENRVEAYIHLAYKIDFSVIPLEL